MLPQGRRLCIDYGSVRVGVAMTDASAILASPLLTVPSDVAVSEISRIVDENSVQVIYIGLPVHLSGNESESSIKATNFAVNLRQALVSQIPIRLIDERLTTKSALAGARTAGIDVTKENVDQLAAAALLEFALSVERSQGVLAGREF